MNKKIIKIILLLCVLWLIKPFTILVLGSDAQNNQPLKGSRTDGMILVKVTPLLAKVQMLSIPRDTYTEIPCKNNKLDKITHAHAFGGRKCAVKAVEKLLKTKVNYNILFKFEDVVSITELIDGATIVSNHTFTQDGEKFVKGQKYNISGKRALAYTRHRKTDSAFKRDERQRQVIQSMAKKMLFPTGWKYIPKVSMYLFDKAEMTINPLRIISAAPAIIIGNIKQSSIEGKGTNIKGVYYLKLNNDSLKKARKQFKVWF